MTKLEKTFTWETVSDLVVNFKSENSGLAVTGWDEETSKLEVKLDLENPEGSEIQIEELLKCDFNKSSNELSIEIEMPRLKGHNQTSFNLFIPKVSEIISETENGPISIKKLHGIQTIKTVNGPIKISDNDGDLEIKSKNGPMVLSAIIGDINIDTENSPIKLIETRGRLTVETKNGPVKLNKCEGELKISNCNGPIRSLNSEFSNSEIINKNGMIYYEFMPIEEGEFNFRAENGRISLIIPDDLDFDLTGATTMGSIRIGLSDDYEQRKEQSKKRVEMVRGTGKVSINADTTLGSIIITSGRNKDSKISGKINFNGIINDFKDFIPQDKMNFINEQLDKMKGKMKDITIPNIEATVEKAMENIERVIKEELDKESNQRKFIKVKKNIGKAMEKAQEKLKEDDSLGSQDDIRKSRLKILKMLEEGKITADEAEKLLKAIED